MRYDACIIGAGADGLACAAWLAARGLKVVVAERDARPGGRCTTREFAPGFHASPFTDELPAIPAEIFCALDLARRGAIMARRERAGGPADAVREAVITRVMADAELPPRRHWFKSPPAHQPWPGEDYAALALAEFAAVPDLSLSALCDSDLIGTALSLLAGPPGGMPLGGLGRLGTALRSAAEESGAEISCGLEVSDIRRRRGRATAVGLADGSEIAARAVISTLDLKRTFLSFFAWNELPKALVEHVGAFRAAPGIARLLIALDASSEDMPRGPIPIPASAAEAYRAWRSGIVPEHLPAVLRVVSAVDPSLAPEGAATLTLTLGAVPHSPFDGAWTHDKRNKLRAAALALVDTALPGTSTRVRAAELIVPPDIENQLALTAGDLVGGELSATQMLGFRPFPECRGSRTPVDGLYLAGPSSTLGPLATCASGVAAARAVLTDMASGRLR
jgi:phytoene dehydrogenase-like protein